jgi:hypothetical protein
VSWNRNHEKSNNVPCSQTLQEVLNPDVDILKNKAINNKQFTFLENLEKNCESSY